MDSGKKNSFEICLLHLNLAIGLTKVFLSSQEDLEIDLGNLWGLLNDFGVGKNLGCPQSSQNF